MKPLNTWCATALLRSSLQAFVVVALLAPATWVSAGDNDTAAAGSKAKCASAVGKTSSSASASVEDSKLGTISGVVKTRPRKYAKYTVVYLKKVTGKFAPPKKHPVMDQKNLIFLPHVLPVVRGTTVDFLNSDNVLHNVFSPDNEKYNLGSWGKGQIKPYVFKRVGEYTQLCNVHPEMQAYVVVLQNPFWGKAGKKGAYKIPKVPPGKYKAVCWSERLKGQEKDVVVTAGQTVTLDFSLRGKK